MRKLSKLLKGLIELFLTQSLRFRRKMGCFFKQARGIGTEVNTLSGSLTAQFRLNFGLYIYDDAHAL